MAKTEAQTRVELINKQLEQAGWNVNDSRQVIKEFYINKKASLSVAEVCSEYKVSEFSDYALLGRNAKIIAVVEAKKTSIDPRNGQEQAKQYCENIQKQQGGQIPFCFYTNGNESYFWDIGNYPPRKIISYPTMDDFERMQYLRENHKTLVQELIDTKIAGRDYQISAIRTILETIEEKKRHLLLVMATGTGKTRTCIALIKALMHAGYVQKVLFLVDRIALREQAIRAFKEHLPDEPRWPNVAEVLIVKDRRIYVSTYPTMLNIIRDEEQPLSSHFFDLVVIDESHRSIYNTYSEILNYFDAITLGLTATPTDIIDHNTFKLFNCEDGLPSFAYTYEQAINNTPPYLCDFEVMKIQTKFQQQGISKRTISLEDQKKLLIEGKEIEEINYEGSELEKTVTNKGTNTLIIREFMDECIKDHNGVLPGKTIFFCMTIGHARRVEEIFNQLYPEYLGELARVIVSNDPRAYGKGGLLDQFTNNDMPRIAISVGMLDTGIDILEITNLVFAKPIYSYTRFWQMIGRGTRLLDANKPKPWCIEKKKFLIIDCWDNFEYFKLNPKGKELKPQIPLPVRFVDIRIKKIEKALQLNKPQITKRETDKLRAQIALLPSNSITIREAKNVLDQVSSELFWKHLDQKKLQILHNEIKPLFKTLSNVDFKAMRFEKDLLEFSLEKLVENKKQAEAIKESIIEQISELPLTIDFVNKQRILIEAAKSNNYWTMITEKQLDELAEKLAPLMNFSDENGLTSAQSITQFNLQDQLYLKEKVEFGPQHESLSISRYKELVEEKILALTEQNPILIKIKQGHDINPIETEKLTNMLHAESPYITEDLLRQVYKNRRARFIQFIRHILGIEPLKSFPDTVSETFQQFITQHTDLTSKQLDFLNLLKNYLIEREKVTRRDLISVPFTTLHPEGIRGIFTEQQINEILLLTEQLVA